MTEESGMKKKYLSQYGDNVNAVRRVEEQIKKLRLDAMCPSHILTGMPSGHEYHDLSDYAVKLEELLDKLKQVRYRRLVSYMDIINSIEAMEDERERAVLTYRYLDGDTWDKAARKLHMEWAQVHRLHNAALKNLQILET